MYTYLQKFIVIIRDAFALLIVHSLPQYKNFKLTDSMRNGRSYLPRSCEDTAIHKYIQIKTTIKITNILKDNFYAH